MGIDYTKRPAGSADAPAAPGSGVSLSKVTLTKAAPTVSLTKEATAGGILRVNLNWTARQGGGGFFARREPDIDLDLACLYEFTDGRKGVVQALGNAFQAAVPGAREASIWLDGDDRSGSNAGGENLFVNLAHASSMSRLLIFAFIYEGVPNWAAADAVVTLFPPAGPQIEVRLDEPRQGARTCAIALLRPSGGDFSVQREVAYIDGTHQALDAAYSWGIRWSVGHK